MLSVPPVQRKKDAADWLHSRRGGDSNLSRLLRLPDWFNIKVPKSWWRSRSFLRNLPVNAIRNYGFWAGFEIEFMQLKRNEIDSGKETGESRNYDTLFGNGLVDSTPPSVGSAEAINLHFSGHCLY